MKKHDRIGFTVLGLFLLLAAATLALAQEGRVDRATVPFSDPSTPGTVKVTVFRGGITVTGYSGKEVTVEARVRSSTIQEQEKEVDEKAKGMRLIRSSASGLYVTEDGNGGDLAKISIIIPRDTINGYHQIAIAGTGSIFDVKSIVETGFNKFC